MYTKGTEKLSHRELQTRLNMSFPKDKPPSGWEIYTPPSPPEPTEEQIQHRLIREIESQRKAIEDEGVTVNGIRYSGKQSNRQALDESVRYAESKNLSTFERWKDSDGGFHRNHPVEDVILALEKIGDLRSSLFNKEGDYVEQVISGELTDVEGLSW